MTYAIVFNSQTGNTKRVAQTILEMLPQKDCLYFGRPAPDALEVELIFVGFWTDKGNCREEISSFLKGVSGKKVALFGTAGFGGNEDYFSTILNRVAQYLPRDNTIVGSFMCQGKIPEGLRLRYEAMDKENPGDPKTGVMLENFDRALLHPDEMDLFSAGRFAHDMLAIAGMDLGK